MSKFRKYNLGFIALRVSCLFLVFPFSNFVLASSGLDAVADANKELESYLSQSEKTSAGGKTAEDDMSKKQFGELINKLSKEDIAKYSSIEKSNDASYKRQKAKKALASAYMSLELLDDEALSKYFNVWLSVQRENKTLKIRDDEINCMQGKFNQIEYKDYFELEAFSFIRDGDNEKYIEKQIKLFEQAIPIIKYITENYRTFDGSLNNSKMFSEAQIKAFFSLYEDQENRKFINFLGIPVLLLKSDFDLFKFESNLGLVQSLTNHTKHFLVRNYSLCKSKPTISELK